MLPLIAPLVFAILGIAALVVDLGLASARQSRLETAAEAIALEEHRLALAGEQGEMNPDPMTADPVGAFLAGGGLQQRLLPVAEDTTVTALGGQIGFSTLERADAGGVVLAQDAPFLFGRGSMDRGGDLPLRAHAAAAGHIALRVGVRQSVTAPDGTPQTLPGVANLRLAREAWREVLARGGVGFFYVEEGSLTSHPLTPLDATVIGHVTNRFDTQTGCDPCPGTAVGHTAGAAWPALPVPAADAYIPIFDPALPQRPVIGFWRAEISGVRQGGSQAVFSVRAVPSPEATRNASASPATLAGMPSDQVSAILASRACQGCDEHWLRVPGLDRAGG